MSSLQRTTKILSKAWGSISPRLKLHATCTGLSLSCLGLLVGAAMPSESRLHKPAMATGAIVTSALGVIAATRLENLDRDHSITLVTREVQLMTGVAPRPLEPSASPNPGRLTQFPDFAKMLQDRDGAPFICLLASQGGGKTSLGSYLQAVNPGVTSITINPHYSKVSGAFRASTHVLIPDVDPDLALINGQEDPDLALRDLLNDRDLYFSIHQLILAVYQEYKQRRAEGEGHPGHTPIDIYIDEANEVYSMGYRGNKDVEGIWTRFIQAAMTGFRKYKLRVILMAQARTVSQLGLEGMAELRDSYQFVYLGNHAIDEATKGKEDSRAIAAMKSALANKAKVGYLTGYGDPQPFIFPTQAEMALQVDNAALRLELARLEDPKGTPVDRHNADGQPRVLPAGDMPEVTYAPKAITQECQLTPEELEAIRAAKVAHPNMAMTKVLTEVLGFPKGGRKWNALTEAYRAS